MWKNRRVSATARPQVESLDARVVPSAMGMAMQAHAAIARHAALAHLAASHANAHAVAAAHHAVTVIPHISPAAFRVASGSPAPLSFSSTIQYSNAVPSSSGSSAASRNVVVSGNTGRVSAIGAPTGTYAITVPVPISGSATMSTTSSATTTTSATSTDVGDIKNGPLAKAGQDLITLYQDFVKANPATGSTFTSSVSSRIEVVGTSVGVDVRGTGDINAFAATLTGMGMQVQAIDPNSGTVEGLLPIGQLPSVAQLTQTIGISPIYRPLKN